MSRNKPNRLSSHTADAVVAPGVVTGRVAIAPIVLFALIGCGEVDNLAPVRGIVTVNGQPLAKAGVTFTPEAGGRPAWATTNPMGHFELSTQSPGDGALIGTHVVTVAEAPAPTDSGPEPADPGLASVFEGRPPSGRNRTKTTIDLKYASRSTSDLRFTVHADEANVADFNLTTQ